MWQSYGSRPDPPAYYERLWRRASLPPWQERWKRLSVPARSALLTKVKVPARKTTTTLPNVRPEQLDPAVLQELRDAGFVEIRSEGSKQRVAVPEAAHDFALWAQRLCQYHLLTADGDGSLRQYVNACFVWGGLLTMIHGVLGRVGIHNYYGSDVLARYVPSHRWPSWVAGSLYNPRAKEVLLALEEAGGPLTPDQLLERLEGIDAAELRSLLNQLAAHLAVFEDLRPPQWEYMVGLLPAVHQDLARASRSRERPALRECPQPRQLGPEGAPLVEDLRAFLLELAHEPPRLRQDGELFQKEEERFHAGLADLPAWLAQPLKWSEDQRLRQTYRWATYFKFVERRGKGGPLRLHLSDRGQRWLAASAAKQYGRVYDLLNPLPDSAAAYYSGGDAMFLGVDLCVIEAGRDRGQPVFWRVTLQQRQALRDALYAAFQVLEPGHYYRLDSFLAHAAFERHNPLLVGKDKGQVAVGWAGRPVPPLEEELEEAGRNALEVLVLQRLIPLGCLRTAADDRDELCIARTPRLDAYFGRQVSAGDLAGGAPDQTRVVVQPDFSVVIIGLNPTPAAELTPFTERVKGHLGQGSMILKLTREAVVKAVANGMDAGQIVDRLRQHAANKLPANVLHEVQEWCGWVRQATSSSCLLMRCQDGEAADRLVSALGKKAERLNVTTVAVAERLGSAERSRLLKQGIIVKDEPGP